MKTFTPAPYRTGFCGTGNHERCRGTYAFVVCECRCHSMCPACGQLLPDPAEIARPADA